VGGPDDDERTVMVDESGLVVGTAIEPGTGG